MDSFQQRRPKCFSNLERAEAFDLAEPKDTQVSDPVSRNWVLNTVLEIVPDIVISTLSQFNSPFERNFCSPTPKESGHARKIEFEDQPPFFNTLSNPTRL